MSIKNRAGFMSALLLLVITSAQSDGHARIKSSICAQTSGGSDSIAPPSLSPAKLAISLVQGRKPKGSHLSINQYIHTATMLSKMGGGFEEVGWGAERSGQNWIVTNVYVGSEGVQRRAKWLVNQAITRATPQNSYAKELEKLTVQMSREQ